MRSELRLELRRQRGGHVAPVRRDAERRHIDSFEARVATRIDREEGAQVHRHIQAHAVVAAAVADLQTERRDLRATVRRAGARRVFRHVNAGRAGLALAREIIRRQRVDHGLLDERHQLAHHQFPASQIEQQIGHDLARPVIRDLAAAVDLDERNTAVGDEQMLGLAGLPERENGRMLDQPDFVRGIGVALIGERAHGVEARLVGLVAAPTHDGRCEARAGGAGFGAGRRLGDRGNRGIRGVG
ncbi:hypothetical protein PT2222_10359 [Paraburkholderia tropica]